MIESIKWSIAKVIDCSSAHYQILFIHTHLFFVSFFNCVIRACDDKRYFGPWEGRCEYSLMYAALCDSFTSFTIIQLHNSLAINHMKKKWVKLHKFLNKTSMNENFTKKQETNIAGGLVATHSSNKVEHANFVYKFFGKNLTLWSKHFFKNIITFVLMNKVLRKGFLIRYQSPFPHERW